MSKIMKYKRFSLVELLLAIGLLAIFFNLATSLYFEGRKSSRKYMDKAAHIQSVNTIAKYWRRFIHSNQQPTEVEPREIKFGNQDAVSVNNNQLIFTSGKTQKTFAFPKGFTASFAQEKNPGESPLLVLSLKTKGSKQQILEDKFIRIIAIPAGGGK